MAQKSDIPSLLDLISTGDLAANEIFYDASYYKSVQHRWYNFKRNRSSTD